MEENSEPARNLRIYLAASIAGGREDLSVYSELHSLLSEYGVVAPEQTSDRGIGMFGERDQTAAETHRREMLRVESADVLVAEVTVSSLGVGYQIARAEALEKPVLCIHRVGGRPLSRLLAGSPTLVVKQYSSVAELPAIVDEFLSPLVEEADEDEEDARENTEEIEEEDLYEDPDPELADETAVPDEDLS